MYIKAVFFFNIRIWYRYSSIYPASNSNFKEFLQGREVFEHKKGAISGTIKRNSLQSPPNVALQ